MEETKSPENLETNSLRGTLELKQLQLDERLSELSDEVEVWNLRLEHVANTDPNADNVLPQIAQEAVNSLDEKWPFYGDKIHVTGKWFVTDFTMMNDTMQFPMMQQDAFNIVQSNGFSVFQKVGEAPRVGLSFAYGDVPIMSGAIQGNIMLLTYADPNEVSLYYVQPGDKDSLKTDLSDIGRRMTYYDQLLYLHYHNENSEFYKKSARKQHQFLNKVTDMINDSLSSPEHGYHAVCQQVEVPYVYRRIVDGRGFSWQRVKASDSQPILLNGVIEGVGILEAADLVDDQPLRSKHQLVDPNAGICLILQVEECSIPDIFNGQPVYVPMRIANTLEIAAP